MIFLGVLQVLWVVEQVQASVSEGEAVRASEPERVLAVQAEPCAREEQAWGLTVSAVSVQVHCGCLAVFSRAF